MQAPVNIERFTRLKQTISGDFRPMALPRLASHLAGDEGEIRYALTGDEARDVTGSQKRTVKCIISGWFFLADPVSLQPVRYELSIESRLVLVRSEADLPPLEAEAEDEDYIVCGAELDVLERVEEEILLDLPAASSGATHVAPAKAPKGKMAADPKETVAKISPFAKLAELKKK